MKEIFRNLAASDRWGPILDHFYPLGTSPWRQRMLIELSDPVETAKMAAGLIQFGKAIAELNSIPRSSKGRP